MKSTAHRSDGSVIKCGMCDKEAGHIIQGTDSYIARCTEHAEWIGKYESKIVFKDPSLQPDWNSIAKDLPKHFKDAWLVDMNKNNKEDSCDCCKCCTCSC